MNQRRKGESHGCYGEEYLHCCELVSVTSLLPPPLFPTNKSRAGTVHKAYLYNVCFMAKTDPVIDLVVLTAT